MKYAKVIVQDLILMFPLPRYCRRTWGVFVYLRFTSRLCRCYREIRKFV